MNLGEMIVLYRAQSGDTAQPYFCDDALLALYANEAQMEACRRGQLLLDASRVQLQAGQELVKLAPTALRVTRAFVDGHAVSWISAEHMDGLYPGWQFDDPQRQVQHLVFGVATGALYLWPRPSQAGELHMTVQRLPKMPMADGGDEPEIRQEAHSALVHWMLYRAYSRMDTDLYNDAKAAIALQQFDAEFGSKASVRNEEWVRSGAALMPGPIA